MSNKPFVMIRWYDAADFDESGWATEETLAEWVEKPCESISYGYLIHKNRDYLTLGADFILPSTYGRVMKIPRRMIQETKEIDLSAATTCSTASRRKRSSKRTPSELASHTKSPAGAGDNPVQDPDPIP